MWGGLSAAADRRGRGPLAGRLPAEGDGVEGHHPGGLGADAAHLEDAVHARRRGRRRHGERVGEPEADHPARSRYSAGASSTRAPRASSGSSSKGTRCGSSERTAGSSTSRTRVKELLLAPGERADILIRADRGTARRYGFLSLPYNRGHDDDAAAGHPPDASTTPAAQRTSHCPRVVDPSAKRVWMESLPACSAKQIRPRDGHGGGMGGGGMGGGWSRSTGSRTSTTSTAS